MIEVSILGPLEVRRDGELVPVPGGKPRALLLALVVRANEPVSQDRLIEALWGDEPPPRAGPNLHVHIATLRKLLNGDPDVGIDTSTGGYTLRIPPDRIDAVRFEQLIRDARSRDDAADRLRQALLLWRGAALTEVADEPFAHAEALRLEKGRAAALEERIDAELALGRHRELVPELESLVDANPLRERAAGQLMQALYASGRQAEALAVYRDLRRHLVDELGIEPNPELQALERAILRQDAALAAPVQPRARRRRRWAVVAAGAAAVVAGAVVAAVVVTGGSGKAAAPPAVVPDSLVQLDPRTGRVVSVLRLGRTPLSSTIADGAIWVVNRSDRTVSRVDLRTHAVRTIGGVPFANAIGSDAAGNIWVSSSDAPLVTRITAGTGSFPSQPSPPESVPVKPRAGALAVGGGYLWVTNAVQEFRPDVSSVKIEGRSTLALVDLRSHRVVSTVTVPLLPLVIAFGYGSAWVGESDASAEQSAIAVVRAGSTKVDSIRLSARENGQPLGIAIGGGSVWVLTFSGSLLRIDPDTRRIVARTSVPAVGEPLGVAYGARAIWVTNRADFSVWKIDPRTNRVRLKIPLGFVGTVPCGVAATDTAVWVTMGSDTDCGSPGTR